MVYMLLPLHKIEGQLKLRIPTMDKSCRERAHPSSYHSKLSVETSVTLKLFWIAPSVSFVGVAGRYARTAADIHRT